MPLIKKYGDMQPGRESPGNASNQPSSRPSTPVRMQTSLLSYLHKGLPTPSSSEERKNDFKTQEPMTPPTPCPKGFTPGQALERDSSSLTEEFEESSLERRSSRVCFFNA